MAENRAKYELGRVSRITPEAQGQPGHRTFRLLLASGDASASLWLEKEQLSQLGLYLQEASSALAQEERPADNPPMEPQWDGGALNLDFKIGQMSLAHSPSHDAFILLVHDVEEPEDQEAKVSFWLGLEQAEELAKEALRVCAAGRPRCALCGRPIDPEGHVCPRANGHARLEF